MIAELKHIHDVCVSVFVFSTFASAIAIIIVSIIKTYTLITIDSNAYK